MHYSTDTDLAWLLENQRLLSRQQLHKLQESNNVKADATVAWLVRHGHVTARALARAMARQFHAPFINLDAVHLQRCPLEAIEINLLRRSQCLPLWQRGNTLFVALADLTQATRLRDVAFHTDKQVQAIVVEQDKLQACIEAITRQATQLEFAETPARNAPDPGDDNLDEEPLVRFVNRLLDDAIAAGVSDVHFEPFEKFFRVRYRRDGELYEVTRPPLSMAARIASRLKVMAQLDIAERRLPQDGRLRMQLGENQHADFRVSSLPTLWGEKLVLRNLSPGNQHLGLAGLGLEETQLDALQQALHQTQGLILVTGPTGSGKTQTLYAGIDALNEPGRNIATVEDPVEFNLEGINQVPVNHRNQLGFARVLRAFLRQDPDVLMVGEIRDSETADIAIKASQTGHLVLSTLHTNNAAEALNRLRNMGIADYNLASSLSLLVAQRLLRRLCPRCKESVQIPENVLREQGFSPSRIAENRLFRAVGCDHCRGGFRGRTGIYEVVPVSRELTQSIMSGAHSSEITALARAAGYHDLRQSALAKVAQGITSLEEANRLT